MGSGEMVGKLLENVEQGKGAGVRGSLAVISALVGCQAFAEICADANLPLEAFLQAHISSIHSLLALPTPPPPLLGEPRLKCLELLISLYRLDNKPVHSLLSCSEVPQLTAALFFTYPWHSFLHQTYLQLVQSVLSSTDLTVKADFIKNSDLPSRLAACQGECQFAGGKLVRTGLFGHAIRLSQLLTKAIESTPELKPAIPQLQSWDSYVTDTLQSLLDTENRPYGGSRPTDSLDDSSDDQKEPKDDKFSSFFHSIDNKEPDDQLE